MPSNIHTSASAFAALQAGKEEGLAHYFSSYYTALIWYGRKMVKDEALAEDLAAEAFVKLWQNRATLRHPHAVKSFLYTTVRHAALDHLRRAQLAQKYRQAVAGGALETDAAAWEIETELLRQLYEAFTSLPPKAGRVLQMHLDGYSYSNIAAALKISEKTARNQKLRAVELLKQRLVKHTLLFVACSCLLS